MRRFLPLLKWLLFVPLLIVSFYFFFVSVHLLVTSEASMTRILIGAGLALLGVLISGYVLAPVLAEQIADSVVEHMRAVFGIIPGGRRRTDPPAEPPEGP